jgi:hypothetical protein
MHKLEADKKFFKSLTILHVSEISHQSTHPFPFPKIILVSWAGKLITKVKNSVYKL